MRGLLIVALLAQIVYHPPVPVMAWEHGWRTERVKATRYTNQMFGYNIGFEFPKDPQHSDRKELVQFLERRGGFVFESGGYARASIRVAFKGVTDKASADAKIKALLPDLDRLIRKLSGRP